MNSKIENKLARFKKPNFRKPALVGLGLSVASVGAFADYSTDLQSALQTAIADLLTDAGLMLADVAPTVYGVMALLILLGVSLRFMKKI